MAICTSKGGTPEICGRLTNREKNWLISKNALNTGYALIKQERLTTDQYGISVLEAHCYVHRFNE